MKAVSFQVQNYRNIDNSGPIPLERVTNFVGRNESGKSALLKALHKFNPATPEPYDAQREFPRDRFTRDFVAKGSNGAMWPVCTVTFKLDGDPLTLIKAMLEPGQKMPDTVSITRCYDGSATTQYTPDFGPSAVKPDTLVSALENLVGAARKITALSAEQEEATATQRQKIVTWATAALDGLKGVNDLRGDSGASLVKLRTEAEAQSVPAIADHIDAIQKAIAPLEKAAKLPPVKSRADEIVKAALPVFIYFENYGILDSAVWLPRFIDDKARTPNAPKIRTISAMFRHVGLDPADILALGIGAAEKARLLNQAVTPQQIASDEKRKEERAIKLNSASIDISNRFSAWWHQRRHKIRYTADGDYFRIWVADDLRGDVEIELEARSKGFQWFFSFYLLFLVESEDGHKNAILLLDEPGLNLHPTAQQELIAFFENLAEKNQLLYSTHSPFLVDGDHLERVRPVTEDETGHSRISVGSWPKDRETIFPLQAAAGYAMIQGLFKHAKNVLVEGISDYYYLHALSQQCKATKRVALPVDIYITPCGGTKNVGPIASLFLGQEVRAVVLLDSDDAARTRKDVLTKELYAEHTDSIIMLDEVLGLSGQDVEVEDILGEVMILAALNSNLSKPITLSEADKKGKSLPDAIKAASERTKIQLPDFWKPIVAASLVSQWAEHKTVLPDEILNRAEAVFKAINGRFK